MRPPVLQEDAAEREHAERERRQKLKQKARDRERTAKERAAAEREVFERESRSRQEAEAIRRTQEAAVVERWGCVSEVPASSCVVQCFGLAVEETSSKVGRRVLSIGVLAIDVS